MLRHEFLPQKCGLIRGFPSAAVDVPMDGPACCDISQRILSKSHKSGNEVCVSEYSRPSRDFLLQHGSE